MTAWKVIKKKDRTSCSMIPSSKYILTYNKGEEVKGRKGTLGIFCFRTRKHARDFIKGTLKLYNPYDESAYKIVKVKSFGEEIYNPRGTISFWLDNEKMDNFYHPVHYISTETIPVPSGTVCFESVIVLE